MWPLPPPRATAEETFLACIGKVRDAELKDKLEAAATHIASASAAFAEAAGKATQHTLEPDDFTVPGVAKKEILKVYTDRMVGRGQPGRRIYDEILVAAPGARCPLCGYGEVSTLDHHLPKAHFPALAVAPLNLVPACTDCNKVKNASYPTEAEHVGLHPYFEDIDDDTWLDATVFGIPISNAYSRTDTTPPGVAIHFRVAPPPHWTPVLAARVRRHFTELGLAKRHTSQAGTELRSIAYRLSALLEVGGAELVREHLTAEAESRRHDQRNGWRTATYTAIAADEWYCRGGFAVP